MMFECCWLFISTYSYSHSNKAQVNTSRNHVFNIFRLLLAQYSMFTQTLYIVVLTKFDTPQLLYTYTIIKNTSRNHIFNIFRLLLAQYSMFTQTLYIATCKT